MKVRRFIPSTLALFLKVSARSWKDRGARHLFARRKEKTAFEFHVSVSQPIRRRENFENKLHNIQKGVDALNGLLVKPGEIFSFWQLVPRPTAKNGFLLSRNIVSGKLQEDYGGGLCQLSSIAYHTALLSGLEITERFNHSVDLYTEEERFTPLGADATVVYGYKDLRFRNNLPFAIHCSCFITGDELTFRLSAGQQIEKQEIRFHLSQSENELEVITENASSSPAKTIAVSRYKRLK